MAQPCRYRLQHIVTFVCRSIIAMASSYVESEGSEEWENDSDSDDNQAETDPDSEIEYDNQAVTFQEQLEEEDRILETLKEVGNMKQNETLKRMVTYLERVTDKILMPSFQNITNMFSNGAIFFVDGDSMLLNLMGDVNYDPSNGGQLLHLTYLCERHLQLFSRKGGKFEIIFSNVWNQAWSGKYTLLLARSALMSHLKFNMSCKVHEFDSIWDVNFRKILEKCKCAFFLIDMQMLDTYSRLYPNEDHMLEELIFHVSIFYSLVGLSLACVDMNNVELTVSTLNAFYCPPTVVLPDTKLRKLLQNSIRSIKESCKPSHIARHTVTLPAIPLEGESDVRHVVTITAAAQLLKDSSTRQLHEDWVRAFLLYSSLLEVLPLRFRGCKSIVASTATFTQFVEELHKHMNCILQAILHGSQNVNYNFDTVSDLWHGNLFVFVVKYVAEHGACEEIQLGKQTSTAYNKLLQEVVTLSGKPLTEFPVTIQRIGFNEKSNERKENTSSVKTATSFPSICKVNQLVPTNCRVTFEFCKDVLTDKAESKCDELHVFITRNSNFEENRHWHSRRPMRDQYDCVRDTCVAKPMNKFELKKYERNRSKFAYFMSIYGSSIEGRHFDSKSIVCESGTSLKTKGSKTKKLGEKAQKIIEDNCRKQQAKTEDLDKVLFSTFKDRYRRYKEREAYQAALNDVKVLEGKVKTKLVLQKTLLYKVKILWHLWEDECKEVCTVSERNLHYAKELFLVIRRILKDSESIPLSAKDSKLIGSRLWQMGLERIAQCWNLPLPSNRSTHQSHSIGISWIDFQLVHLGPELERELGSKPDKRVEGFMPDKWQTELFDSVDRHQSVLVVAPTSSGKTYASYYCMEQVLRESNDGIVVYVAPTKALVNQVAATIYARFKNKVMPAGKSVYGVFTRDYRTNALNSQILVTVPECLALLLLSPRRHRWARNLRYVIFDEIHCLAGQAGGFSWECGLLLIRCPFLALSATVEDPESLHKWLQSMQDFKWNQDVENGCENHCDFYKVNLVVYRNRHADLRKHVYCEDGQFHHIHPYAYLDRFVIEEEKGIPQNIALSPQEVHDLYRAMNFVCPQDPQLSKLDLEMFFSTCTSGFISRKMVLDYEMELKKLLEKWAAKDDGGLESVVERLRTVTAPLGNVSERRFIIENFVCFVQKLQEQKMLPAIVFSYNRELVNNFFECATEYYEDIAQKYEDNKESKSVGRKKSGKDVGLEEGNARNEKKAGNIEEGDFRVSRGVPGRNKYEASLNLLHTASSESGVIRGVGHADEKIVEYIEHRLVRYHKQGSLFPRGLRLGIGIHYGGMNSTERSAVEMLFRMKMLNLVFATGTLALGIHMPCKTVAIVGDSPFLNPLEFQQMSGRAGRRGFDIEGNVVFMGLNERKMCRLLLGKLPNMHGNFPLNVTMVLRLLLMVSDITADGSCSEEVTRDALSRALTLLNCCLIYQTIPELKIQMKHFFAFSTQLLMLQGLLDDEGNPQFFTGFITHLHYHEPGNLAFVYLLRSGALRKLCTPEKDGTISKNTQMNVVVVLSYLFAPLILHKRAQGVKYNNSKVVLPCLPKKIKKVLKMYNEEVMYIYDTYFKCVAKCCAEQLGEDDTLPMSGVRIVTKECFEPSVGGPMNLERYVAENCEPRTTCSAFSALSGHTDRRLYSHNNMISNIRHQVFTDVKVVPILELDTTYNGYVWDFYNHGIAAAIRNDNGLKQGRDYELLLDFLLVLKVIKTSLLELEPIHMDDQVLRTFITVEGKFNDIFEKAYKR